MKQSKLIQLLKTCAPEDWRRFKKLLQSPFFTTNENLLRLYNILKQYHPEFDSPKLEKEKIYARVYPATIRYDSKKMRALMAEFTKLMEDYFLIRAMEQSNYERKKRLIKIYGEQNLFPLFERGTKALIKEQEALPYRDVEFHEEMVELRSNYFYHPLRQKFDQNDNTLSEVMAAIDQRFILSKLRFGIEMRNQERIFQKKFDFRFWDILESEIAEREDNIAIQVFRLLFKLFSEEKYEDFEELEDLFFSNLEQLRVIDAKMIYVYGLNYIVRKVNQGVAEYSPKALYWYKFGLKDDLLIHNGKLSEVTFGNIVIYGCREKKFDWVKSFIDEFGEKLNSKQPEDVIQFNLGLWNYYQKRLDEAFSILNQFDFHHLFQLKVRLTSLRILFEQFQEERSYYDSLISFASAFLKYMQRTQYFSESTIEYYKNTAEIIKSLSVKIWNNERQEKIQVWFNAKLKSNTNIAVKQWLINEVKNIK